MRMSAKVRSTWWLPLTVVLLAGALLDYGHSGAQDNPANKTQSQVKRGEYLVTAAGCNDCHTPATMTPEGLKPDMSRLLSGHPENVVMPPPPKLAEGPWVWAGAGTLTAFSGPWGVSYAANLTPDTNTGLGIWTEDMFVRALRTGRHMGTSRPIQPPMPWLWYRHFSDEDLKAIYAYLRSIPPITNHVPEYQPPPTND